VGEIQRVGISHTATPRQQEGSFFTAEKGGGKRKGLGTKGAIRRTNPLLF